MTTDKSFEVIVRRKIPYLTDFVFKLLVACTIGLLIFSVVFLPTEHQSDEMKVAFYILFVPNSIKNALLFFGVGFMTFLFLYKFLRLNETAMLTFLPDKINIIGQRLVMTIPVKEVSKVYCIDVKNYQGESKEKMSIYFDQNNSKTIKVRLKNYLEVDEFMDKLMQYKNINFQFCDFNVNPVFEGEE